MNLRLFIWVAVFPLDACSLFMCQAGPCAVGQYLGYEGVCLTCPKGTFMPISNQACRSCIQCTLPRFGEVITRSCTSYSDTRIACRLGEFHAGEIALSPCRKCHDGKEVHISCSERADSRRKSNQITGAPFSKQAVTTSTQQPASNGVANLNLSQQYNSATSALSSTTSALYGTTSALYSTTSALYGTTSALYSTTSALYSTTSASYSTTSALSSTTSALSSTTSASYSTTSALSSTTSASYSTTSASYSTTSASYSTDPSGWKIAVIVIGVLLAACVFVTVTTFLIWYCMKHVQVSFD